MNTDDLTFICDACETGYRNNGNQHPSGPCAECSTVWRQCPDCDHHFGLHELIDIEIFGPSCLGELCSSYDPDRDPFNPIGSGPRLFDG